MRAHLRGVEKMILLRKKTSLIIQMIVILIRPMKVLVPHSWWKKRISIKGEVTMLISLM
jgi:hypothetical protein